MTNVFYIKAHYTTHLGSLHEDGDGSDYSGFHHEVHTDHWFEISNKPQKYLDQSFNMVGDKSYVIAVIYGDGGTFGRTDGYVQYIGAFCKEKANEIFDQILKVKYEPYNYRESKMKIFKSDCKKLSDLIGDNNFYPRWLGYFGSFEKIFLLCSDGNVVRDE